MCLKCSCVECEFKDQPDTTLINHIETHIEDHVKYVDKSLLLDVLDGISSEVYNELNKEGLNTDTISRFLHRKGTVLKFSGASSYLPSLPPSADVYTPDVSTTGQGEQVSQLTLVSWWS